MKKVSLICILFFLFNLNLAYSKNNEALYEKIDLFGEVLEKIKNDYVDDVDQVKET